MCCEEVNEIIMHLRFYLYYRQEKLLKFKIKIGCFSGADEQTLDARLYELSRMLTHHHDIRGLAFNGLGMATHEVENHITNNMKDINLATYYVLTDWRKTEKNDYIAAKKIDKSTIESKMLLLKDIFQNKRQAKTSEQHSVVRQNCTKL